MKRIISAIVIAILMLTGTVNAEEIETFAEEVFEEIVEIEPVDAEEDVITDEEIINVIAVDDETFAEEVIDDAEDDIDDNAFDEIPEVKEVPEESETESEQAEPEPFTISVSRTSIAMGLKEKYGIMVSFSDGVKRACRFSSKNSKIAQVSSDGKITAVKKGSTTITVNCEGRAVNIAVTVKNAPKKVSITPTKRAIGAGDRYTLKAVLPSGTAGHVYYSSSNNGIATVNDNGTVCAVRPGTVKITAKTYNGKKATATIYVKRAPESLKISDAITLGIGQNKMLKPVLSTGSAGSVKWYSEAPDIASITSSGSLKGIREGTAVIRCETYNHLTATCVVTVKKAPGWLKLQTGTVTIAIGQKLKIPVIYDPDSEPGLSYSSSKKKYAAVDASGMITGKKKGTATITAKTYNGKKVKLKVKVKKGKIPVELNRTKVQLGVGERRGISVTSGISAKFYSANTQVATVDASGRITAIAPGETLITAKASNGKSASCCVTVSEAPTAIEAEECYVIGVGQTIAPRYTMDGFGTCVFETDNKEVIAVNRSTGKVTALAAGSAEYRIVAFNGVTGTCRIDVLPAPKQLEFGAKKITIEVGDTARLPEVSIYPEDAYGKYDMSISAKDVADIDEAGTITGLKAGTCVVTVKAYNGARDTFEIRVIEKATSVKVTPGSVCLRPEETHGTTAVLNNGEPCAYYLESMDESVVRINDDGISITAMAPGLAIVTAHAENGLTGEMIVEVVEWEYIMKIDTERVYLYKGNTHTLKIATTPVSGGVKGYESSNSKIATVSASGVITAVGTGSCTITCVSEKGYRAQCEVIVDGLILDLSHYETVTDFDALAKNVSFVILRATCGLVKDNEFDRNARELNKRGVPFGVYCYGKAESTADAEKEADELYRVASGYNPKYYIYDAEAACLTQAYIVAFRNRIASKSNVKKVGCYCAHHKYTTYNFASIRNLFDFVWIPRYGKNDGTVENSTMPNYPCDLWQYTSRGKVSWIDGYVDMNRLTGTGKSLSWFCS